MSAFIERRETEIQRIPLARGKSEWRIAGSEEPEGLSPIGSPPKIYPTRFPVCRGQPSDEFELKLRPHGRSQPQGVGMMERALAQALDTPGGPPRGGENEPPQPEDPREPGGDVKEPPPPGTAGNEEKFPRKGDV
jgi:hypothetical protein